MPKADLVPVAIDDFSAGIVTNTRYQGGEHMLSGLGVAQESGTYRCMATPQGALIPAPRRTLDITLPQFADWVSNRNYWITGFDARIGYVFGATTNLDDRVELHFHVQYQNGADHKSIWYRYRIYDDASLTLDAINTLTIVGVTLGANSNRFVRFEHARMNPVDPTTFGQVVTVACWAADPGAALQRWAKAFPDPASPTTNSVINVGDPASHGYTNLAAHQGRVVFNRWLPYDRGVNTDLSITDNWYWTAVNTNTLSADDPTPFVYEVPQGIMDLFSMTANELFAVKAIGGGFVVRGSIDNPTVIQLPNIASATHGERSRSFKGTHSPIGVIYCGLDGAYVWNGGDSSELISGQLEADFYDTGLTCLQHNGQASRWGDLVVFPQNWMLDTNTRGWWRIEDPADLTVTWWSESRYKGQLYGAYHNVDNTASAGDLGVMWRWSHDSSAYSYSWKSQPIPNVDNRVMIVREVSMIAQGETQDVTITVENEDGDTETAAWTIAGGDPLNSTGFTKLRKPLTIQGRQLTVRVQVDGSANTNAGAMIRNLTLGMDARSMIPNE